MYNTIREFSLYVFFINIPFLFFAENQRHPASPIVIQAMPESDTILL